MSNDLRQWITLVEADIVLEAIEKADVRGNEVLLYRDPSAAQVGSLLRKFKDLRGIEHADTIWIWKSYDAVHFQIEVHFGFQRNECAEFSIRYFPDGGDIKPEDDYGPDVWLLNRADHLRVKLTRMMQTFPHWTFRP
jgi:hypothetical protein